jgi:1-acyl-sn-glycerol-3-phosphate acyltransferase
MLTPTASASRRGRLLYGAYAWFILLFAGVPVAAACLLLPGLERRRAVARWGAAATLRLIGSSVQVLGRVPTTEDVAVVIANHQSYLDGIILAAVLPPQYTFLIKREMVRVPIAGFVLRRLGSEFVDRTSPGQRHRSARRLVQAARDGRALAIFPEGTFDHLPGLKSFHHGAFRAAWQAGLPIAPVVITGAREKLRGGSWLPRPGPLTVEFCPIIVSSGFADQQALVRATRAAILQRLDEPDLDPEAAQPPETAGAGTGDPPARGA